MNDDRIVRRSALDLENPGYGLLIKGIGRQTIYRLGGENDNIARSQLFHSGFYRLFKQLGRIRSENRHGCWLCPPFLISTSSLCPRRSLNGLG